MGEILFEVASKDWAWETLGEVCRQGGGDIQTGPFGSQLHASDYVLSGIPSIMPQNISKDRVSTEGIARISVDDANRLSRYLLKEGDIIYSRRGDVERRALITEQESGWLCGTGCLRVRFGSGVINPKFAAYFLSHPASREWVVRHAVGATMPNLNTSILSALPFLRPQLHEQSTIAEVLGSLDDKIDSNRLASQALERLARAIFRAWFVDFEPIKAKANGARFFPGVPQEAFEALPIRFTESELGPIPEGWQTRSLFDTATYVNGAAYNTSHFCDSKSGLPIIKIAELKTGIDHQTRYSNRNVDPKQRIDTGDLVYSWSGSPDTSLDAFLWTGGPGLLNQHIFKVITPTIAQRRFVYYLLRDLRSQLVEIARNKQTTGLGHVTVKDMKRLLVVKAPDSMLEYFDDAVGSLFDRSFCCELESIRLTTLRDYLLPKLLSGEIRVADAERIAP